MSFTKFNTCYLFYLHNNNDVSLQGNSIGKLLLVCFLPLTRVLKIQGVEELMKIVFTL